MFNSFLGKIEFHFAKFKFFPEFHFVFWVC